MIGGLYGVLIQAAVVVFIAAGAWFHGYNKGADVTRAEYATRDLQAATEAQAAYARIVERHRAKEQEWQKSLTAVSAQYQKRIAANETQRLADLAAIDSRTLILRDPNASGVQACSGGSSPSAGTAAGRNGATGAELSSAASRFLLELASEADSIVGQLSACQAILRSERQ